MSGGRDDAASLDAGKSIFEDEGAGDAAVAAALNEDAAAVADADAGDADAGDGYVPDDALGPGGRGGVVLRYSGGDELEGIPARGDFTGKASAFVAKAVASGGLVLFMPCDVEEAHEFSRGGVATYVLRIYGALTDGSKAVVIVTGIEVFFDVAVPAEATASPARLAAFDTRLRTILAEVDAGGASTATIEAYPARGYHTAPRTYKRVTTTSTQLRKKAIEAIRTAGLETASDDRTCYYRKAAREKGLPLSDWVQLTSYEYEAGPTEKAPLCAHIFRVPIANYRAFADPMSPPAAAEATAQKRAAAPLLARDRTLLLTWDIETHSARGTGDVPDARHDADNCFMLCMTAHWKDDPAPLCRICIVDVETAPDPAWTTIVCGGAAGGAGTAADNILRAFALCWRSLAPDIVVGFNDTNYDWPFVVEKARRRGILGWMFDRMSAAPGRKQPSTDDAVMNWSYKADKRIKISAEEVFVGSHLKVPGCVPIDVRVCFKKLYPKSETPKAGSLKFYLEACNLGGKADMPIRRMWRYYETALAARAAGDPAAVAAAAEHMREVAHYCVVDALRCAALLIRRNIINDYREVSTLAYVSLADSHFYAGGMKVCNLLGAYASRRGILISMIPLEREETGKYPGAYVFPPEKGVGPDPDRLAVLTAAIAAKDAAAIEAALEALGPDRPVTGLDFASLYPSLIMTYNLSPEKMLGTAEEADRWRAAGRDLHPVEFQFGGRAIRAWSVRHGNRPEDKGLYPCVLEDLFAKRAAMKVRLGALGAIKEFLELTFGRAAKDGVPVAVALRRVADEARAERDRTAAALAPGAPPLTVSPGATAAEEEADMRRVHRGAAERAAVAERIAASAGATADDAAVEAAARAEYDRVCFEWLCANTKQNALKVYMNTFYGEAGNSLSPFFMLELAGGVTSAGQYNIKRVADFVREKGFRIKYGDTDSLYLVAPRRYFEACDADYVAGRLNHEEWMAAMVRVTMRALNLVRDEVNAHLRADNGSGYLKMAYEEVLYPFVFAGKKRYFGIAHLTEVNFRPKKLFIRGIDVVKQGQPGFARDIGYRIMWDCMRLDNTRGLRRIVEDVIRDAVLNTAQWNFDHFVKTDAWKPNKNNQPVQRFMARMRARIAVEAARGGSAPAIELPEPGERFSYVIVKTGPAFDLRGCKAAPKKGDRMEFAKIAREQGIEVDVAFYVVSYVVGLCARFINGDAVFQPPPDPLRPEKKIDELSQKAAKKALEAFVKGLSNVDASTLRRRGYAYRRAYTAAAAGARAALVERIGASAADVLHGEWIDFGLFLGGDDGDDDGSDEEAEGAGAPAAAPTAAIAAATGSAPKPVDALWANAAVFADEHVRSDSDVWCAEVARLLGIASNGCDIAPAAVMAATHPAPVRPAAASPAGNLFRATATPRRPRGAAAGIVRTSAGAALDRLEAEARKALAAAAAVVSDIAGRYEAGLASAVLRCRADEHAAHPEIGVADGAATNATATDDATGVDAAAAITEADRVPLLELRRVWFDAVGVLITRRRAAAYADYLRRLKDRRLATVTAPPRDERDRSIAEGAAKLRPCGDIAINFG
jgi:DNA polymerase elongation subunit (family B)